MKVHGSISPDGSTLTMDVQKPTDIVAPFTMSSPSTASSFAI